MVSSLQRGTGANLTIVLLHGSPLRGSTTKFHTTIFDIHPPFRLFPHHPLTATAPPQKKVCMPVNVFQDIVGGIGVVIPGTAIQVGSLMLAARSEMFFFKIYIFIPLIAKQLRFPSG